MAVAFAEGTGNYIRTRAFEKIENYSFKNFDQYPTGELMSRLTNDIYQINIAVQLSMRFLLAAPFTIIIADRRCPGLQPRPCLDIPDSHTH